MEIVQGINQFQHIFQGRVYLALGNFDGVHLGHKEIIRTTVELARESGTKSAVLVLMPHPLAVLCPDRSPELLLTVEDRIRMLGDEGIDYVIIHPFTREFAAMPPETFAAEILHGKLRVAGVVVGFDYSFGRRGSGSPAELQQYGLRLGYTVQVMEPVSVDAEPIGSTAIRMLLAEGRVEKAARMLGYSFYLRGQVVHGDGRGRTLGFPTANVCVSAEVIRPGRGVYLSEVEVEGERSWALTNVGFRPTFCKTETSVEVYLLDTEKNLYGQELIVRFLQKIREEQTFASAAELVRQIQQDVALARTLIQRKSE